MNAKTLRYKIINGEIDPNNMELFFGDAIKAAILFLNKNIKLRNKRVPHFIMNTGDEIMYRELMDYQYSKTEVTDENFIYNEIPRCIVNVDSIQTLPDQLTQPYSRGYFEFEYEDGLYEYTAELRRMPCTLTLSLKYYLDSFTDCLAITQHLISDLSYVRNYNFVYLGNEVSCSLTFPDSESIEKPSELTFDSENRYKTISIDLTLETNFPIFDLKTAIESSAVVTAFDNNIGAVQRGIDDEEYVKRRNKGPFEEIPIEDDPDDTPEYIKKATLC